MNLKSALQLTHYEKHYKIEQPFLSARPQIWQQMTVSAGDWGEGFRYCCLLSLAKTKKSGKITFERIITERTNCKSHASNAASENFQKIVGSLKV